MLGDLSSLRESLAEMVNVVVDEKLKNDIRTTIPGHILSFDPDTQLATVQVGVQRIMVSGDTITPPPIVKCPVCVYGATGGLVEVEISKGDECAIHFSMRCIDGWREQGGVAPIVSVERYRQSDAFVVLGARSKKNVIEGYSNNGIKLRSKDGAKYVWLKNDGTIELSNGAAVITMQTGGSALVNGCEITPTGNLITALGSDLDALWAAYSSHNSHPPGAPS